MSISRSFYFIRHGQTDWNAEGRMQGQIDIPLNDVGRAQAQEAIAYFKNLEIDLIVSSPLTRAYETAEIIASAINVPIEKNDALLERNFGSNQGRFLKKILQEYKDNPEKKTINEVSDFPHAPDAETYRSLEARIVNTVNKSLDSHQGTIMFSGHEGGFSALYCKVMFAPGNNEYVRSDNAIPYYFEKRSDGAWQVEKVTA